MSKSKHYAFLPIDSDVMHYRHYTDDERVLKLFKSGQSRLIILPFEAEEHERQDYVMALLKKGVTK